MQFFGFCFHVCIFYIIDSYFHLYNVINFIYFVIILFTTCLQRYGKNDGFRLYKNVLSFIGTEHMKHIKIRS